MPEPMMPSETNQQTATKETSFTQGIARKKATNWTLPLAVARHEKFCQNYTNVELCQSQTDAFIAAYPHSRAWKRKSACVAASRLASKLRPRIEAIQQARVDAIFQKWCEK